MDSYVVSDFDSDPCSGLTGSEHLFALVMELFVAFEGVKYLELCGVFCFFTCSVL